MGSRGRQPYDRVPCTLDVCRSWVGSETMPSLIHHLNTCTCATANCIQTRRHVSVHCFSTTSCLLVLARLAPWVAGRLLAVCAWSLCSSARWNAPAQPQLQGMSFGSTSASAPVAHSMAPALLHPAAAARALAAPVPAAVPPTLLAAPAPPAGAEFTALGCC